MNNINIPPSVAEFVKDRLGKPENFVWDSEVRNVVWLSYGKDSMAQLLFLIYLGVRIDEVCFVDIRFSKDRSGEHPKMEAWIPTAHKILKELGIKVKKISAKYTFKEYFYRKKAKGNKAGEIYGFPYTIGAWCNSRLKVQVMNQYIASLKTKTCQWVGIAADEWWRLDDMIKSCPPNTSFRSVLVEKGIEELFCLDVCKVAKLASPKYTEGSFRGGCWFCVKQRLYDLYDLWKNYPSDYNELLEMEKDSPVQFNRNISLANLTKRFESGYIPPKITKRRKIREKAR